jgi:hypothetical protein
MGPRLRGDDDCEDARFRFKISNNNRHNFAISPRVSRKVCQRRSALFERGRGATPRGERGMPDARCVRSRVCIGSKHTR